MAKKNAANTNGGRFEKEMVEQILIAAGVIYERGVFSGSTCYGTRRRPDFVVTKPTGEKFCVEAKYINTYKAGAAPGGGGGSGTRYETLPALVQTLADSDTIVEGPTVVVLNKSPNWCGRDVWLRRKGVDGVRILGAFYIDEFKEGLANLVAA